MTMTPDMQRMVAAARNPFGTESGLSEHDARIAVLAVLWELSQLSDEAAATCGRWTMTDAPNVQRVVAAVVSQVQAGAWPKP
jgi:hypothetical protein